MANKRMIASDIWRDDFVCTLDYFKRLLWIGMVVTCADDQGRIQDRAGFIASDVFPGEMLSYETIEDVLKEFEEQGKILRYTDGKVRLIQIINWWNYQSPSWASASKYQAPSGWVDRVKMHVKDNKIVTYNWEKKGGFQDRETLQPSEQHSTLPSELPSTIEEGDGNGGGVGNGDVDVDVPAAIAPGDNDNIKSGWIKQGVIVSFEQVSGLTAPIDKAKEMDKWFEYLERMTKAGVTPEIMEQACQEMTEKKYKILGPWSIERPCEVIMSQRKRETVPRERKLDSAGKFAEYINH